MENREAARALFAVAGLLEAEGANPYRVRAYRRAAASLLALPGQAAALVTPEAELPLPWLGSRLRKKLGELLTHGHMQFYDELVEALPAAKRELLAIPGVGPRTAALLITELGLTTADAVAEAATQGRLRTLRGIGARRERQLGEAASTRRADAA